MALMNWSDSLSVGVKSIDEQHKGLLQAVNDLHAAMVKGQVKMVTGPLLKSLAKYTKDHFTAEEAMLRRASYPGLSAHHAKHVDLNRQVEQYIQRFERGEISINVHLLDFLRDWLVNHIQKDDRDYGPWLNERGIR
jgi:hemerythrin-like metal-binding protein